MTKAFKIFVLIILSIGLFWGAVHKWGSEELIEKVGYGSSIAFGIVIIGWLVYTFVLRKKK